MMLPDPVTGGRDLFASVFSDEPVPDIEAAIVVAHPGDEAVSASWFMARLQERTSVYCLARAAHSCPGGLTRDTVVLDATAGSNTASTAAAAALAGVPPERCHNLGLSESELARDLEALVWLTMAAVSGVKPRVLVTHACEGQNLDHDATAFAVHMTARLLTRAGSAAPLIVELPRHPVNESTPGTLLSRQAVRIEFGPESRKVKKRMLQCHCDEHTLLDGAVLHSESYVLAAAGNPIDTIAEGAEAYVDAPWCPMADFRRHARDVAAALSAAVLSPPSRA